MTDNRSIKNEKEIDKSPTVIQSNNNNLSGIDPSAATSLKIRSEITNDKKTARLAIPPLRFTGKRLLSKPTTRKPNKGNMGISQAN
jgi:hypothetical protein